MLGEAGRPRPARVRNVTFRETVARLDQAGSILALNRKRLAGS